MLHHDHDKIMINKSRKMMDFGFSNHTDTAPAIQVRNLTWPILLERQEVSTKNMTVGTPEQDSLLSCAIMVIS